MNALALLPGFTTRETAPADSGLAPKPPNPPKPPPSLGALGGLGDGPRSEPAIASEGKGTCADDLIRQRARDAVSGEDEEHAAIRAEEAAPMLPAEAHAATVAPLLLAASPLAGVPGARRCPACGRGIWCSPSWVGPPPPDLCAECWASEREAGHERNPL